MQKKTAVSFISQELIAQAGFELIIVDHESGSLAAAGGWCVFVGEVFIKFSTNLSSGLLGALIKKTQVPKVGLNDPI